MGMGWSVESGMTVFWMFAMAGPTPYGWGLNPRQPIHAKWVFGFYLGRIVLAMELRTLHMLDNCSTTELCLQQFMYLLFFFLRFGLHM